MKLYVLIVLLDLLSMLVRKARLEKSFVVGIVYILIVGIIRCLIELDFIAEVRLLRLKLTKFLFIYIIVCMKKIY